MFFGQSMLGDATFGSIFDDYAATINQFPSIGNVDGGTVYGSDGGSWWDSWGSSVIPGLIGVGSQAIGAWGRNPTQQVGIPGAIGIGGGYTPASVLQASAQQQAQIAAQQQALLNSRGVGQPQGANSLDGIFGSLTATISNNPLIFAGGVLGLYLLFREPPRGRR